MDASVHHHGTNTHLVHVTFMRTHFCPPTTHQPTTDDRTISLQNPSVHRCSIPPSLTTHTMQEDTSVHHDITLSPIAPLHPLSTPYDARGCKCPPPLQTHLIHVSVTRGPTFDTPNPPTHPPPMTPRFRSKPKCPPWRHSILLLHHSMQEDASVHHHGTNILDSSLIRENRL